MTIGEKVTLLKDRLGFKDFQAFGKWTGINGSWLLDQSKKTELITANIDLYKKLAIACNISLDWLLLDDISECVIPVTNLDSNDLLYKLNELQQGISTETTFNGIQLNDKQKELVVDGIDVLKQLINSGI